MTARKGRPGVMIDLLIIGGGIHGTCLSHLLTRQTPLTRDDVRVLDPHDSPLAVWGRCTGNCGMRYLRSPSVHHLDAAPLALDHFALRDENRDPGNFLKPRDRPSLAIFQKHCRSVIGENRLAEMRIKGRALAIHNSGDCVTVETDTGELRARVVLLAIGMGERLQWSDWALSLRDAGAPIRHIFESEFQRDDALAGVTCIVGAGMSGVNLALRLAEPRDSGENAVLLVGRRGVRVAEFDFDPGWLGPKYLDGFQRANLEARRRMIDKARLTGTVPRHIAQALEAAVRSKRVAVTSEEIMAATFRGGVVTMQGRDSTWECDRVVLATGFAPIRPGNGLIDGAVAAFNLKTSALGFPVIDEHLRWHERIFVTGPLSELQVGPCARNIAGARHAARRIAAAFGAASDLLAN